MSVLKVVERADLRTGDVSYDGSASSQRVFQVITSTGTADESVIFGAVDPNTSVTVPSLYAAHPTRFGMYCTQIGVRWTNQQGREAVVTCTYGYIQNVVPWEMPFVYNWGANAEQRVFDKDIGDSFPVFNSCRQPFDPPPMVTRYAPTMQVQCNILASSLPDLRSYLGCVNSGSFHGFAQDYVMLIDAPASEQFFIYAGVRYPYYSVTYSFQFKNPSYESWQPLICDTGFCKLNMSNFPPTLIPITIAGRELSSSAFLNGSGQPLAEDADPYFFTYRAYQRVDFSALGV